MEVFGSFSSENWIPGKILKNEKKKKGRKEVNSQAGARVTPRRDTGVAVRARGWRQFHQDSVKPLLNKEKRTTLDSMLKRAQRAQSGRAFLKRNTAS